MKIGIVSHSYPFYPGDWRSNFIASLAQAYGELGNDVTVFTPFFSGEQRRVNESSQVKISEYKYMPFKSWHLFGYGQSMKDDLKMSKLTLLLTPFLLLVGMFKLARLLEQEKFDFLHCHWAVPNTLIAIGARWLSRSKTKILTSFPGSDVTVISNTGIVGRAFSSIISKSDYMSCNSSDLKEELVKCGINQEKIDYVIYGVNDEKIFFSAQKREIIRQRLAVDPNTIMLLMIGRFIPKKGFSTAFRALKLIVKKNANVKLVIIGDGEMKSQYESILKQDHTADYALFIGYVHKEELMDYYSASDIFLMPSEKKPADGLNTVVPEAMACGRPIIASNVGGNDLVVFDGVNGFLHHELDHEMLALLANKIIEDKQLREELGKKSLELVQKKFNWQAIAKYYIEKYRGLYGKTD